MLRGRRAECDALDRLPDGARAGQSGVLVLSGEPGVGKTALLECAIGSASDLTVLRAAGVQSQMELPFATLHQFCAPLLDSLDRLPGPQSDEPMAAFGGVKTSGDGEFGGTAGIESFTEQRWVTIQHTGRPTYPF